MKKLNKSLILTVLSVLGLGTTTVLAVRSGMKTRDILNENPNAKDAKTIISLTWKSYIATLVSMVATGTCIISAHTLDAKQVAALSGIVATGATTFSKYRSKVTEVIGPEEEKKIFDAVQAETKSWRFPDIIDDADYPNDTLFLDDLSGRYFYSSVPKVFQAIHHINYELSTELIAEVNNWYKYLGISEDSALSAHFWHYDLLNYDYGIPWINIEIVNMNKPDGTPYKMISIAESPVSKDELKHHDPDMYKELFE